MNPEKMTTTLQSAIAEAQQVAITRHHQEIDIAHLWKILLQANQFGRNFIRTLVLMSMLSRRKLTDYWMKSHLLKVAMFNTDKA